MPNQNPEQLARDNIDALLTATGWIVQSKKVIDLNAGQGVAVREYSTEVGGLSSFQTDKIDIG